MEYVFGDLCAGQFDVSFSIYGREIKIVTTNLYWDCECKDDYIKPAHQSSCNTCGAVKDDQPDSRINEVEAHGLSLGRYSFELAPGDFMDWAYRQWKELSYNEQQRYSDEFDFFLEAREEGLIETYKLNIPEWKEAKI